MSPSSDATPLPDPLDGVTADPEHHRLLFENDQVRVVETTVRAGQTTPRHTHRLPTLLYAVSGSHFVRRLGNGEIEVDTRTTTPPYIMPRVQWSDGVGEHTLENPGPDDLIVIGVELKPQTKGG